MNIKKTIEYLLYLVLFFLPLQTRFIWHEGFLGDGVWEYGTFSLYIFDIIMLPLLILLVVDIVKNHRNYFLRVKSTKLQKLFFLSLAFFIVWSGISIFWAENSFVALFTWFRLIQAIAFALAIVIVDFKGIKFLWSVLAGFSLQAFWGIYQFSMQYQPASKWLGVSELNYDQVGVSVIEYTSYAAKINADVTERVLRAYAGLPHPNIFGAYMFVALSLALFIYTRYQYTHRKIVALGIVFLSFVGLLLSFSRSAWLAAFISFVGIWFAILVYFRIREKKTFIVREFRFEIIKITFFLGGILLLVFAMAPHSFMTRLGLEQRLEQKSIEQRVDGYQDLQVIMGDSAQSIMFGHGIGQYTVQLAKNYPERKWYHIQPVHNIYALILAELGVLGLLSFLGVVGTLIAVWVQRIIKKIPIISYFEIVFVLIGLLVVGLFDHFLWTLVSGIMLFWLILGICARIALGDALLKES